MFRLQSLSILHEYTCAAQGLPAAPQALVHGSQAIEGLLGIQGLHKLEFKRGSEQLEYYGFRECDTSSCKNYKEIHMGDYSFAFLIFPGGGTRPTTLHTMS